MGIRAHDLRLYVVRPALPTLVLWSPDAEAIVLETFAQESHCGYWLDQADKYDKDGPAYGPGQMEKPTHDDIWKNYLLYQKDLAQAVKSLSILQDVEELRWNLFYAAAMTRVHYRRVKSPLPNSIEGRAQYWKDHYNTAQGKGTVEEYLRNWKLYGDGNV